MRPTFLIVGAAKSGTTSLTRYLQGHPEVFMPSWKEPGFFSPLTPGRPRNIDEYMALFNEAKANMVVGEASTAYLFDKCSPEKIYETLGAIKIIVILRNPLDMAYSLWAYNRRSGIEDRPFRDAFMSSERPPKTGNSEFPEYRFLYRERVDYLPQIKRYLDVFPKECVRIYVFEEFFDDVQKSFSDVCCFLDISSSFNGIDFGVHNSGASGWPLTQWIMRNRHCLRQGLRPFTTKAVRVRAMNAINKINRRGSKPNMDSRTREELSVILANDVKKVEQLLNRKIPKWG